MDYINRVQRKIGEIMPDLAILSKEIWNNPEYSFEEYKASAAFAKFLETYGFFVEKGIGGLETAVKATFDSKKRGPHIGLFGEYDAVPGMGHSCGHNLIAAMAAGSGIAVKTVLDELGGMVTVFGTPAEEGGGGKVIMLENGVFDSLDIALILHPANETVVNDISYSKTDVIVDFYGMQSHAATWPEEGVSALTPVIELFNLINAMRLEIADRGKILGIITKGGDDPIYIPEHCQAKFTVRSFDMKYKYSLIDKLITTCEYLARITGTRFEYHFDGHSYEDIRNNPVIERLLEQNLTRLGEKVMPRRKELGIGCTDMGNVTHKIPGLQSYILVTPLLRGHTLEFEKAVGGPLGLRALEIGAKALAMTAVNVLADEHVFKEIQQTFQVMKNKFGWED